MINKFCFLPDLDLVSEVQSKMTKIPGGWQCRECPYNSKFTTTVRRHIEAKHMMEVLNKCELCGATFTISDALKRHMKTHFVEEEENLVFQ